MNKIISNTNIIFISLLLIFGILIYNFMTSWVVIIAIYIGVYLTGTKYFNNLNKTKINSLQ